MSFRRHLVADHGRAARAPRGPRGSRLRDRSRRRRATAPCARRRSRGSASRSSPRSPRVISAVAADARWLAALGHAITARGGIPDGVPFASAPTQGWPNVPGARRADRSARSTRSRARAGCRSPRSPPSRSRAALRRARRAPARRRRPLDRVRAARRDPGRLRRDRRDPRAALLARAVPAARRAAARRGAPALAPDLARSRRCSRLWSNLHGAALTGLAVAGAYLVLDRARREPLVAVGVLLVSLARALPDAGAASTRPPYYAGVLGGEAARQGIGLWAPFSFSSGPDIATLVCLALAVWPLVRARPRLWELVALAGLVVLAARTVARRRLGRPARRAARGCRACPGAICGAVARRPLVLGVCGLLVPSSASRAGRSNTAASAARSSTRAVADAHGTPVIADSMLCRAGRARRRPRLGRATRSTRSRAPTSGCGSRGSRDSRRATPRSRTSRVSRSCARGGAAERRIAHDPQLPARRRRTRTPAVYVRRR